MADRIIISTQWLDNCSTALRSVQNTLNSARSSLKYVDLSREAGGDKSITFTPRSLRCGARIYGNEVDEVLHSAGRGIDALSRDIADLIASIAKSIEGYESAEVSITRLANGIDYDVTLSVYNSAGVMYARYEFRKNEENIRNKNREAWNALNNFRDTEYDRAVREGLHDLIVNDPRFRKSVWDSLDTDAERRQFVSDMLNEMHRIYQTDLTGGLYFVSDSDFPAGQDSIILTINGVDLTYYRNYEGGYAGGVDAIVVKMYKSDGSPKDYGDIIDTLAHDNRHNLQTEIMNATDLDKYDGVNGGDYDAIVRARNDWINNRNNHKDGVLTGTEGVTHRREILSEMNFGQLIFTPVNKVEHEAALLEYEDYAEQQNEVDARYTGEYAASLVAEQRAVERKEKRDAKIAEIKEDVDNFTDYVREVFDMSKKGWDTLMNT